MLAIAPFTYSQEETYKRNTSSPLLCWDIANPALDKQLLIREDIEQLESLVLAHDWQLNMDYKSSLKESYTLIVTNISKEIIWASSAFQSMTAYSIDEAIGRNPSFLQGKKTNLRTKTFIKHKLANFENLKTRIVNYRKNGESYLCSVEIFPVKNSLGLITHFIAIEKEVN